VTATARHLIGEVREVIIYSGIEFQYRKSISMSDGVLRHLYLGFIRLHILYHAAKEAICGVELMEELQHHGYDVGPGTLYPVLHQLHRSGLIRYEHEVIDGKRRKNIRATAAGKKLLREARTKLRELYDQDARQIRTRLRTEN
jgi:PadR family transcriptional regulator, regulatory protein PadR